MRSGGGTQQGWIRALRTPLCVCGANSAFLGFEVHSWDWGLFGAKRLRAVAIAGLLLVVGGICLFLVALNWVGRAAGGKRMRKKF